MRKKTTKKGPRLSTGDGGDTNQAFAAATEARVLRASAVILGVDYSGF